jgi:hypothetical protein
MTNRLYVGNLAFHATEDVINKAGRCASTSLKTDAVAAAADMVARAAVAEAAAGMGAAVAEIAESDLHPIAIAIGEAWAHELVRSLRSVDREIIGAWPGTMREARTRVRVALRTRLELHVIDELARVAYLAARRGWQEVSEPDPET